ncbi:hypothetical protein V5N11_010423 [Cardamine amara subsp. amara]|uniref:Zinc finger protein n=1 Tax=Cardamine amara subsp. amara TaxID=228776 RepID=A0ABD0ZIN1_CARAN
MCHHYYHKNSLYNSYASTILPRDFTIPIPKIVANEVCYPPVIRPQPGSPKNSRIKLALEVAMEKKRPRKQHTCGNCNLAGHNRKTCIS